jgi:adenylate kinase family enzyme
MILTVERIVILGCAGTGKTTLARQLGRMTGAPVICLDEIWQPVWTEKDVPAFRAQIEKIHAGDNWISDGNFAVATFDLRLPRATLVIWLQGSKLVCSWRVIVRAFSPGEGHGLSGLLKVLAFVWNFDRINRPRIEAMRLSYGPHVPARQFIGSRNIEEFLSEYEGQNDTRVLNSQLPP